VPKKNYYAILEVDKKAKRNDIDKAYKELMSVYAPDSCGTYSLYEEDERENLLSEIEEAYEVLSDNKRRSQYDENVSVLHEYKEDKPQNSDGKVRIKKVLNYETPYPEVKEEVKQLLENADPFEVGGHFLRKIRQAADMTVKDLGQITKLTSSVIQMLEEDNYLALPARTYALGFLRIYLKVFTEDYEKFVQVYVKKYDEFVSKRKRK